MNVCVRSLILFIATFVGYSSVAQAEFPEQLGAQSVDSQGYTLVQGFYSQSKFESCFMEQMRKASIEFENVGILALRGINLVSNGAVPGGPPIDQTQLQFEMVLDFPTSARRVRSYYVRMMTEGLEAWKFGYVTGIGANRYLALTAKNIQPYAYLIRPDHKMTGTPSYKLKLTQCLPFMSADLSAE